MNKKYFRRLGALLFICTLIGAVTGPRIVQSIVAIAPQRIHDRDSLRDESLRGNAAMHYSYSSSPATIPEPSVAAMAGMFALIALGRRRRRRGV